MRSFKVAALLLCGSLAVLAAGVARADDVNVAAFRPSSGSDGLLATEGARPLIADEGRIELRLFFDGAYRPVEVPTGTTGRQPMVFNRAGGWAGVNLHLFGPLSVAAQMPFTFNEFGNFDATHTGAYSSVNGLGDVRITPRIALLRQEDAGLNVAIQGSVELPTGTTMSLTTDTRVNGEALLAVSRLFGAGNPDGTGFELLANVYGRFRPDREIANYQIGSGGGARLGGIVHVGDMPMLVPARIFGEVEAQTWSSTVKEFSTPAEWRAGLGWCFKNVSLDVGGGAALTQGVSAAQGRFLAGLGYSPGRCGGEERRIVALRETERARVEAIARAAEEKRQQEQAAIAAERDRKLAEEKLIADRLAAEKAAAQAAADKAAAEKLAIEASAREAADKDAAAKIAAEQAAAELAAREAAERAADELAAREAAKPEVTQEKIVVHQRVEFAPGKAKLTKGSFKVLDEVVTVLNEHPEIAQVEVQGHTDATGTPARNLKLSQARAEAVAKYLTEKGVAAERILARGYGQTKPIDDNATKAGRDRNRRVEFMVLERERQPGI